MTDHIETLYGPVSRDIFQLCRSLKLLVLDVDGVLSDGYIYLGNDSEELKAFNTKDGYGIKAIVSCGIDVAVITGRQSAIVQNRMAALNVKYIIQGEENKSDALSKLLTEIGIGKEYVASMGDDVPDLGLFAQSALMVAVNDAHPMVKQHANLITTLSGGRGAVREFCDLVLQAKDQLDNIHGASV
jgi:3-deoxy-D-manno-octulosonate 8-phosphate phosphatase (KDO 8-P phosphatase)